MKYQYNPKIMQAYDLLHKGTLALARAEQQGIRVDREYVESEKQRLTQKINELEQRFKQSRLYQHWAHTTKTVNINSNAQLAHFLYDVKKLTPAYTTESGQGATDEAALQQLGMEELRDLIEIRKLRKVRDTYLDAYLREQVDGYIHPFFNLHLVRTYRSSSDSPNFQNIPHRDAEAMQIVRRGLFPRPGHRILEMDFSNLEVRIATCYHKDPKMITYIKDPTTDMHRDMAKQLFILDEYDKKKHYILRQAAKNGFVFPEFYGDYYGNCAVGMACTWGQLPKGRWQRGQGIPLDTEQFTLADHLIAKGIPSLAKFTDHVKAVEKDFWENRFPDYATWKDRWWRMYQKHGYIDLLTGFRCTGVMSRNEVINTPVQGAAFHCLLWAFIELDRRMQEEHWDTKLIGQIHDSIIMDVLPEELPHVVSVIRQVTCEALPQAWPWIIVPLDVEIEVAPTDGSWAEKTLLTQ
jgi:DNA polymerase-1